MSLTYRNICRKYTLLGSFLSQEKGGGWGGLQSNRNLLQHAEQTESRLYVFKNADLSA